MKKIVIVRGKIASGKSTISSELTKVLPGWVYVDMWKIKEMFEPLKLKNRKPSNSISKDTMFFIIERIMKDLGLNIVIQESRQETVNRYLKKDLKKHGYKIYSFYLDIDLKTALRRNIEREKKTMLKKYFLEDKSKPDEKDIVINTNNNSIKQVINLILKEIGEKRRKHELAHKIRKTV